MKVMMGKKNVEVELVRKDEEGPYVALMDKESGLYMSAYENKKHIWWSENCWKWERWFVNMENGRIESCWETNVYEKENGEMYQVWDVEEDDDEMELVVLDPIGVYHWLEMCEGKEEEEDEEEEKPKKKKKKAKVESEEDEEEEKPKKKKKKAKVESEEDEEEEKPKKKTKKEKEEKGDKLKRENPGLKAFQSWAKTKREKVKKENPDATFGEIQKILGAKWKKLSEDEQKEWYE
jgi:hypothetical protein